MRLMETHAKLTTRSATLHIIQPTFPSAKSTSITSKREIPGDKSPATTSEPKPSSIADAIRRQIFVNVRTSHDQTMIDIETPYKAINMALHYYIIVNHISLQRSAP